MIYGPWTSPYAACKLKKEASGRSRKPLAMGEGFLRLRYQSGSLLTGNADSLCRFALLQDAYVRGVLVVYRFHITETDALRLPVTQVTFENLPVDDIEVHGAERTHGNA
jgi:hypothetical protein